MVLKKCKIPDCPKQPIAKGFCNNHYNQNLHKINPLYHANQLALKKRWRKRNKARIKAWSKEYKAKNKEKIKISNKIVIFDWDKYLKNPIIAKNIKKIDKTIMKIKKKMEKPQPQAEQGLKWGKKEYTLPHYHRR